MTLELLPRSLGIGDVIEAATQRTYAEAQRRMLSLEQLAPAFTLLTDRTGRAVGPETMRLYAEHFAAIHVSIEAVYEAVRDIVLTWEKAYWPTAEYIGNVAQRKLRSVTSGPGDRAQAVHDMSVDAGERAWEDRVHRAEEWFNANPAIGKLLLAGIDAAIAAEIARRPNSWLATNPAFRRAWRHGDVVGVSLRHVACGNVMGMRMELRKLGERFPDLAVDLRALAGQ